jgi:hypothetical protein
MLNAHLFLKQSRMMKDKPMVTDMRYRPDREKLMMPHQAMMKEQANKAINNTGVSQVPGHTKFGYQTILDHQVKPLHTAPGIVGGNVDWTKLKVSPATRHLQTVLSERRSMSPAPALGSGLGIKEPSRNTIDTNI